MRPLQQLRELTIEQRQWPAVPHDIKDLPALTYLSFSNVRPLLGSIWIRKDGWPDLGSLTQLSCLCLSWCGLTHEVMPRFKGLTNLRTLLLHQHQLSALPAGLQHATALEALNLHHGQVPSTSGGDSWDQLLRLPRLRSLRVSGWFGDAGDLPDALLVLPKVCNGIKMNIVYRQPPVPVPLPAEPQHPSSLSILRFLSCFACCQGGYDRLTEE
jgi:Leucine-rich repeat (LRR) protein